MPSPRHMPRLLWVEGKDDRAVTNSLCAAHGIPEIFKVLEKSGVEELLGTFFAELRSPAVERFGIVVDANGNAQARWNSIRHTLEVEGYVDVPHLLNRGGMIVPAAAHRPTFGAWIMPDNHSPGALEDFAAALVPTTDALWIHASDSVDSIPETNRRFPVARRSKAHMHTWLAWQEHPGSPMGQAITKGDLNGRAALASEFIAWINRLMVAEK